MFSKISFAPCAAMPSVGAPPLFDLVGPTQSRSLSAGALQLATFYDRYEEGRASLSQELQGEFAEVVKTIAGQVGARGTLKAVVAILCPSLSLSAREPSSSARGSPAVRNAGNLPPEFRGLRDVPVLDCAESILLRSEAVEGLGFRV